MHLSWLYSLKSTNSIPQDSWCVYLTAGVRRANCSYTSLRYLSSVVFADENDNGNADELLFSSSFQFLQKKTSEWHKLRI